MGHLQICVWIFLDALWHLIVWVVGTDTEGSLFKYIGGSVVERNVRNSYTPLGVGVGGEGGGSAPEF